MLLNKSAGFSNLTIENSVVQSIHQYKDHKQINIDMVATCKSVREVDRDIIYRGDCVYLDFLKSHKINKFYNQVSSWTSDIKVAAGFANVTEAPDWYWDEEEWNSDDSYPFKGLKRNMLSPVIFRVYNATELFGIKMANYVKDDLELEYVIGNVDYIVKEIQGRLIDIQFVSSYDNFKSP